MFRPLLGAIEYFPFNFMSIPVTLTTEQNTFVVYSTGLEHNTQFFDIHPDSFQSGLVACTVYRCYTFVLNRDAVFTCFHGI